MPGCGRKAAGEHRRGECEAGRDLSEPDVAVLNRIDGDASRERLETQRGGRDERAADRALRPPLLAEPAEQRPRHDPSDQHAALAEEEPADRRQRDLRLLDGTERHQAVAEQRRVRAGQAEQRRAARLSLRRSGDEGQDEPRRREQADVARPARSPSVAGAGQAPEVLVAGPERGGKHECERDDHGSILALRPERSDALEAVRRPKLVHVVVDVERRDAVRQHNPRQLRAGEDVHVR
jgi:hypothetical protein